MTRTTGLLLGCLTGLLLTGSRSWRYWKACQITSTKFFLRMMLQESVSCGRYVYALFLLGNELTFIIHCRILFNYTTPSAQKPHLQMQFTLRYGVCTMLRSIIYTFTQAKSWVKLFLTLNHLQGYQKKCVTPYMHSLVYHVPAQLRMFGNLMRFSGQGTHAWKPHCYLLY